MAFPSLSRALFRSLNSTMASSSTRCSDLSKMCRPFTRTMWCLTKKPPSSLTGEMESVVKNSAIRQHPSWPVLGRCNCCGLHTQGDKDLAVFLTEEIKFEKEQAEGVKIPTTLDGFNVTLDENDVTLTKTENTETVVISFTVSNALQPMDDESLTDPSDEDKLPDMVCLPTLTVDIKKADKHTLSMQCSFSEETEPSSDGGGEGVYDVNIDEVAVHDGEWGEETYSLPGELMDGTMYDLLHTTLEERGLSGEFLTRLIALATDHEKNLYIDFLHRLRNIMS